MEKIPQRILYSGGMKFSNVVNIVSDTSTVNLGVWKAAVVGHHILSARQITSYLFVTSPAENSPEGIETISIDPTSIGSVENALASRQLLPSNTLIVTHGSWLSPSRLGRELALKGYAWVYVPQGMLEPWSMEQKKIKKQIYFRLFERRFIRHAVAVRAVSGDEQKNLERILHRKVVVIGNGVRVHPYRPRPEGDCTYLFMARLHHKKGVYPLVKAWTQVMKESKSRLIICGSDEGELAKIKPYINGNIEYRGLVLGNEKMELLERSHYFVLPSHSEGLPSGVLEAMGFGLVPVISEGCNLPEVFNKELGYRVDTTESGISNTLMTLRDRTFDQEQSLRNHQFIIENYSEDRIGEKLLEMYSKINTP